jgi:hypothetical protein
LAVRDYGENDSTVQLCANCHELYHLLYNAIRDPKSKCNDLLNKINIGEIWERINWMRERISEVIDYHQRAMAKARELIDKRHELMDAIAQGTPVAQLADQHGVTAEALQQLLNMCRQRLPSRPV